MIHGDADELVPEPSVRKLVDKLNTQKGVHVDYRVFPGADHVFANHADAVGEAVEDYCGKAIARRPDGAGRGLAASPHSPFVLWPALCRPWALRAALPVIASAAKQSPVSDVRTHREIAWPRSQ